MYLFLKNNFSTYKELTGIVNFSFVDKIIIHLTNTIHHVSACFFSYI